MDEQTIEEWMDRHHVEIVRTHATTLERAFELEFFIFRDTYDQARRREYTNLDPVSASTSSNIYLLRNAHNAKPFMDEVVERLNWQHFPWESWSNEGGVGQVELNFSPTDPVKAADTIVRAKQLIYELGLTLGCQ